MPELPEVQTIVTTLAPCVTGQRIRALRLLRTDIVKPLGIDLPAQLTGKHIKSLTRRAKRIVFTLDGGDIFYIKLGMTGRLTAEPPDAPLHKHCHLMLTLQSAITIRFCDPRRFGGVVWIGKGPADHQLGPEPLEMSLSDFASRLKKTRRSIKNALMDQRLIAGLGNIYVDESLHEAGIHPLSPSHKLNPAQVSRLACGIKKILLRAITARGSTLRDYVDANGNKGAAQKLHRVYHRAGRPCRKCSSEIQRIIIGGRSTHFCPDCQPRHTKRQ